MTDDHALARTLSKRLSAIGAPLRASTPDTNIVQVQIEQTGMSSHRWVDALSEHGVFTRPWGETMLRCVTHRHIDADNIAHAADAFAHVLKHRIHA
jgi:threonine aldolase